MTQLSRDVLEVLANISVIARGEHQLLDEEIAGLRKIRDRVELQEPMVRVGIHVCDAINKAGLPRDVLLRNSTVVVFQKQNLDLDSSKFCDLIWSQFVAGLQLWCTVRIGISRIAIEVGRLLMDITEIDPADS